MKKLPLILIGGGGHCRSSIDVIVCEGKFEIRGILDSGLLPGSDIDGFPVLGNDDLIDDLIRKDNWFLVCVGQIKNVKPRINIYNRLRNSNAKLATIVSPLAHVSSKAGLGAGVIVMHGAIVNAGAQVGNNTIINTKALVEHDCRISDHVHVSTGCLVNGGCSVEEKVFLGSGAVLSQGVSIASGSVIGSGAVVIRNINDPGTYAGNPAIRVK